MTFAVTVALVAPVAVVQVPVATTRVSAVGAYSPTPGIPSCGTGTHGELSAVHVVGHVPGVTGASNVPSLQ